MKSTNRIAPIPQISAPPSQVESPANVTRIPVVRMSTTGYIPPLCAMHCVRHLTEK